MLAGLWTNSVRATRLMHFISTSYAIVTTSGWRMPWIIRLRNALAVWPMETRVSQPCSHGQAHHPKRDSRFALLLPNRTWHKACRIPCRDDEE